ncbi:hypothetical protein B0H11DRAFT_2273221, partial [Mycena galericulata]
MSILVDAVHTSSVSLSSSSPRSLVSSRFIQAHFASRRSTHFEFVVAGGAYGPFSIGLTCSVSPYLTADVVLGLDWQRGLREWFSRGPRYGQSNNLDVSSFLHAPSPTSSSVITPTPTPTEAAQNVPNAASLIGAGSLPTSVTLASMASVGPTVSAASSSMPSIYPITQTRYNNDAFVLHPVAFAHGSGLYTTQDSSRSTAAYPVPHPS